MTIYSQLYAVIPRDLRRTLSGARQYAEDALEYATRRRYVFKEGRSRHVTNLRLEALRKEVEGLALALFCHAAYRRFVYGDRIIKEAVGTFTDLGIPEVKIGASVLSKSSKLYDMGRELAERLYESIDGNKLRRLVRENADWHEIADAFREAHNGMV